ncbi:MAG: hypothetical protein HY901_07175 [Deltaproteobacteria bacterium]|nr:hypothetical protein [Deltaproteobacteria bacterium]
MQESELRKRIQEYLRTGMLPAALGLALASCGGEVAKYMAPMPEDSDAGQADAGESTVRYAAPMPDSGL